MRDNLFLYQTEKDVQINEHPFTIFIVVSISY